MQKYLVQTANGDMVGLQDKNNYVLLINESYFHDQISKPLRDLSSRELNNLDLGPCEQCASWLEMVLLMPESAIVSPENAITMFGSEAEPYFVFPLAAMYHNPWILKIKSFN